MTRTLAKTLIALGMVIAPMCALAQDPPPPSGWEVCIDPTNTAPYSPDYGILTRANDLWRATVGLSGTVTYGGPNGPCFVPAQNIVVAGRLGFAVGPVGSAQSDIDNDMQLTFGMPFSPGGNWSTIWIRQADPSTTPPTVTSNFYGAGLTGNNYSGQSGRYIHTENSSDNVLTIMRVDIVGDAARVQWDMTNLNSAPRQLGLWYGAEVGILPTNLDNTGFLGANTYWVVPGRKPLLVDTRINRNQNPSTFPPYIQACYGQTNAYGLQVDLGPTETSSNTDATNADEVVIGLAPFVLSTILPPVTSPPDHIFGDVGTNLDQFLIKYEPASGGTVPINGIRTVNAYFHSTWGNSKYTGAGNVQAYTTVVDFPHLLGQDDGSGSNGLANNPFTVRVYVDNSGGYANVYTGFDVSDIHVTLNLPPGLSIANGDPAEKVISVVKPKDVAHVDWQVQADGIEVGDLPYTVTIRSVPGPPQGITHSGVIRVSATKQVKVEPGANLISAPWVFGDTSWESVLGLQTPQDFTAYTWDPVQNSYVVSSSARRGEGVWIVMNPSTHPSEEILPYNGANTPSDITTGAPNIQLKGGWNLIGNPYPYAFPVSQFVGVSAANPSQSFIFADLVAQGVISPYLAYWDPAVNNYRYAQGLTAVIQPNRGYWIKVNTAQDLTLQFPPIYDTFVPGGRAVEAPWVQTADHWRLNLRAQSARGADVENYVGAAVGADTRALQIPKPPQGPTQDVTVSVIEGTNQTLAQAIRNTNGAQQWKVAVQSKAGGPISLTWPNLSSLPRALGLKIADAQTGQTFDLRSRSVLTFNAAPKSVRYFKVISTGVVSTPIIGSALGSTGRLSTSTPASLRYSLNRDASVTIRVLDLRGTRVIATLTDGEARRQGANTAAWDLRDSNGAAVPAGTYQFEIVATADGSSSRKAVGVLVNR